MLQKLLWWFYKYGETDIPDFDMKQLCIEDGLSVFPDLVTEITDMMVEVNGYIDTKARQDLPHQQYENDFANLNYNQLTEVGGFIKYYGGVEEIMYTPHSQGVEIKYNFPLGIDVGIPTFGEFKFEVKAEPSSHIILWHTHPGNFGLSEGDVLVSGDHATHFDYHNIDFYTVLHNPLKSPFQRYKFKNIS